MLTLPATPTKEETSNVPAPDCVKLVDWMSIRPPDCATVPIWGKVLLAAMTPVWMTSGALMLTDPAGPPS